MGLVEVDLVAASNNAGEVEGKRDQRNKVWSSEPEIRSSGVVLRSLS